MITMIRTIGIVMLGCLLCAVMVSCNSQQRSGRVETFEVFGKCPKCGTTVGGHLCFWDGHDEKGNPVSGTFYQGVCPSCKVELTTGHTETKTNVVWKETIRK
jgi:hypothetical protein